MKRILTISAVLTLVLMGCTVEPVANFAYSPGNPIPGEDVYFDNLSINGYSYEWNFDDGTVSYEYEPIHQFPTGGTYVVELKVFGRRHGLDVYTMTVNVQTVNPDADFWVSTVLPTANGDMSVETDIVYVGEQVEFNNISTNALSYQWNFGDGYTSDISSPVYSYDEPGTYSVTLIALAGGKDVDIMTKSIEVVEGINSTVRITVLEYWEEYPVEGASVILFGSVEEWEANETAATGEAFTTPLGKCVFEGLDYQRYYVDVLEEHHNNYDLAFEDVGFIETQLLEPGYIHDFIAYVDHFEKKMVVSKIAMKALAKEEVSAKKSTRELKINKFTKTR